MPAWRVTEFQQAAECGTIHACANRVRPEAALSLVGRHVSSLGSSGNRRLAVEPGESWGFPVPFPLWHLLARIAEMLPGSPLSRAQVDLMEADTRRVCGDARA